MICLGIQKEKFIVIFFEFLFPDNIVLVELTIRPMGNNAIIGHGKLAILICDFALACMVNGHPLMVMLCMLTHLSSDHIDSTRKLVQTFHDNFVNNIKISQWVSTQAMQRFVLKTWRMFSVSPFTCTFSLRYICADLWIDWLMNKSCWLLRRC